MDINGKGTGAQAPEDPPCMDVDDMVTGLPVVLTSTRCWFPFTGVLASKSHARKQTQKTISE